MRIRDDITLRRLRNFGNYEESAEKKAESQTGVLLRKRAQDEKELAAKRRKDLEEEKRLAANEEEARRLETAQAQKALQEAKNQALQLTLDNRRSAEENRKHTEKAKEYGCWLQTVYPSKIASKYIDEYKKISPIDKATMANIVAASLKGKLFTRNIYIPELWLTDNSLLLIIGTVREPGEGGRVRNVLDLMISLMI